MNTTKPSEAAMGAAELKPCPFCGGQVCRDFVNDEHHRDISCHTCGESFRMPDDAWNTRASIASEFSTPDLEQRARAAADDWFSAPYSTGQTRCEPSPELVEEMVSIILRHFAGLGADDEREALVRVARAAVELKSVHPYSLGMSTPELVARDVLTKALAALPKGIL